MKDLPSSFAPVLHPACARCGPSALGDSRQGPALTGLAIEWETETLIKYLDTRMQCNVTSAQKVGIRSMGMSLEGRIPLRRTAEAPYRR